RPDAVGALGEDAPALVEHLVEDHDALVGQPDLVRVRVHQCPADVALVPRLDGGVQLTADVLDGLLHMREQSFELWEDRIDRHRELSRAGRGDHPAYLGARTARARRSTPLSSRADAGYGPCAPGATPRAA